MRMKKTARNWQERHGSSVQRERKIHGRKVQKLCGEIKVKVLYSKIVKIITPALMAFP
jgi:hypothetical protein